MRKILMTAILASAAATAFSQSKKDEQSIKSLCGCYDIEFKYAETFASDSNYKLAKPYTAHGREWVESIEEAPGKFSFQHLLVINDSTIIKHWREDWKYQNTELLAFEKSGTWKKVSLPANAVKGQWTQTVWEVDDAPRYQGTASWVYTDGKAYWENNTDAPLPRREYSIRSDYNVLNRNNRIWLTNDGWSHEQDNKKVLRKDGAADRVLVQEKGYNIYHKVDDSKCAAAKKFWQKNKEQWVAVRKKWDDKIKSADGEFKL
jgi:hypothetical protein